jgi:hypothetical protein
VSILTLEVFIDDRVFEELVGFVAFWDLLDLSEGEFVV